MRGVDGKRAEGSGEVLGFGEGLGDGFGVVGAGAGDGVENEVVAHVAEGGVHVGILVGIGSLPCVGEGLGGGAHVGHVDVVGEGGVQEAFHGLAADLDGVGIVHGVRAHHDEGAAEFAGLLHDDGAFSEVGGHEHDVGLLIDDFGELGGEVLVAGIVLHVGHDLTAELLVGALEEAAQAHGVVVGDVHEDGGLFHAEGLVGVGSGGSALIGIDEAGAEVVLLALGDEGAGAGGAHAGHAGLFADFAAGHGQGGAVGADCRRKPCRVPRGASRRWRLRPCRTCCPRRRVQRRGRALWGWPAGPV